MMMNTNTNNNNNNNNNRNRPHLRGERKRSRYKMSIANRPLLLALALVMVLGIAVYFRLWVIDYKMSSGDTEMLRRQFDLAHREAVDESAEWRLRFDEERDRVTKCLKELTEVKGSLSMDTKDRPTVHERLEVLQKENMDLLERLKSLTQDLEAEKLKCKAQ